MFRPVLKSKYFSRQRLNSRLLSLKSNTEVEISTQELLTVCSVKFYLCVLLSGLEHTFTDMIVVFLTAHCRDAVYSKDI